MHRRTMLGLLGVLPLLASTPALLQASPLDAGLADRGEALQALRLFTAQGGDDFRLHEGAFGTPRYLSGVLSEEKLEGVSWEGQARGFLVANRSIFPIPAEQLVLSKDGVDEAGGHHLRFDQVYRGIPVFNGKINVHMDANGVVLAVNSSAVQGIRLDVRPTILPEDLPMLVSDYLQGESAQVVGTELTIWPARDEKRLVFQTALITEVGPRVAWFDAHTGDLVWAENPLRDAQETGTGVNAHGQTVDLNINKGFLFPVKVSPLFRPYIQTAGRGRYNMVDLTTQEEGYIYTYTSNETYLMDIDYVSSSDNSFDDPNDLSHPAGTSAHDYFRSNLDFYKSEYNRNGLDDNGLSISAVTQVNGLPDIPMECNAGWLGYGFNFMIFGMGGDCYGYDTRPFSAALDVIGHELNHGVNEFTINLGYNHESGALSEHFSDVFGVVVEAWTEELDWLIGEELFINPEDPNSAFRNFADPADDAVLMAQPDHMDVYYMAPVSYDAGGVHFNSGIVNKAFYLMVEGGNFYGVNVPPFAADEMESLFIGSDLFYDVMVNERISNISQFNDLRDALLDAAQQLRPSAVNTIEAAFEAVGIVDDLYPTASQDLAEPNDYPSTAIPVSYGSRTDQYIWARNDADIYSIELQANQEVRIVLSRLAFEGQLNLYNVTLETLQVVAESNNDGLTDEVISYTPTSSGEYYIEVIPNTDVEGSRTQKYSLVIDRG